MKRPSIKKGSTVEFYNLATGETNYGKVEARLNPEYWLVSAPKKEALAHPNIISWSTNQNRWEGGTNE